ncbi:hypothetical protein ACFVGY_33080 [Streptomyces sp. NPDC127106]|uniref:hypothetical protein n=1 Tax=Streptomyces sp. NPDC127106 TaxID=3345360 RepID=UPI003628483F
MGGLPAAVPSGLLRAVRLLIVPAHRTHHVGIVLFGVVVCADAGVVGRLGERLLKAAQPVGREIEGSRRARSAVMSIASRRPASGSWSSSSTSAAGSASSCSGIAACWWATTSYARRRRWWCAASPAPSHRPGRCRQAKAASSPGADRQNAGPNWTAAHREADTDPTSRPPRPPRGNPAAGTSPESSPTRHPAANREPRPVGKGGYKGRGRAKPSVKTYCPACVEKIRKGRLKP